MISVDHLYDMTRDEIMNLLALLLLLILVFSLFIFFI
jgi:hypothetical protein